MRSIPPRILLALSCASALLAAACAATGPPALSSDLAGTQWTVSVMDGQQTGASAPTVTFDPEDRIRGSSGCNSFSGIYEAQGGAIDVRGLGATERACADSALMRREASFLATLANAIRYRRDGERLVITAANDSNLVLTPASG